MGNFFDNMEPIEEPGVFDDMEPEPEEITKSEDAFSALSRLRPLVDPMARGEAGLAVAGGMGTMATAGLAGTGTLIYEGIKGVSPWHEADWNAPAGVVEGIQQSGAEMFGPRSPAGQQATEDVMHGIEGVSKGVKAPLSVYPAAWAGMVPGGNTAGEEWSEFMNTPTGEYLANQAEGAPAWVQTMIRMAPDVALASLGIGVIGKAGAGTKVSKLGDDVRPYPEYVPGRGDFVPAEATQLTRAEPAVAAVTDEALQSVAKPVLKQKEKTTAIRVDPNPEMVEAFNALDVPYGPQMVSESLPFRQVASGLKSDPASKLKAADEVTRKALQEQAESLVRRWGQEDRSVLDADLKQSFNETIHNLQTQSDKAFKAINTTERLSSRTEVTDVQPVISYLNRRRAEMGGIDEMSRLDQRLFNLFYRKRTNKAGKVEHVLQRPTYGKLDFERKLLGQELKTPNLFRDSTPDSIDMAYGLLRESQGNAATRMGFGDDFKAANELIITRKMLETESVVALGREMSRGVLTLIDQGATKIPRGDVNKFRQMMAAVPEQHRQTVAMAVLERVMLRGAGREMKPNFVKLAQDLEKNKIAKDLLFEHLPKEARLRFDHIAKAAEGFYRSLVTDNTSNTAQALRVMDEVSSGGMAGKLAGAGGTMFTAEWLATTLGLPPGYGVAAGAAYSGARQVGRQMGRFKTRTEKADEFMVSDTLNTAVRDYAAGREAQSGLVRSKVYQDWLRTVTPTEARTIRQMGFFGWLLGAGTNE